MQSVESMIRTHPAKGTLDPTLLAECIRACFECAPVCTSCADACLAEDRVQELVRCIRLNLDCAAICDTTGRVLSRQTDGDAGVIRAQLQACAAACRACATECEHHAEHMAMEHCGICAAACRRCEECCDRLLGTL